MLGETAELFRALEERGVTATAQELGIIRADERIQEWIQTGRGAMQAIGESMPVQAVKAMVPERHVENATIALATVKALTKGAINKVTGR
jgi:stage V sporulation protein SpoVS